MICIRTYMYNVYEYTKIQERIIDLFFEDDIAINCVEFFCPSNILQ